MEIIASGWTNANTDNNNFKKLKHSMGGRAMMAFAVKYPEFVDRLVLVDITPFPELSKDLGRKILNHNLAIMESMMSMNFEPNMTITEALEYADQTLSKIESNNIIRPYVISNLRENENGEPYWTPNLPVIRDFLYRLDDMPAKMLNSRFDGPTLFIRGSKSPYLPEATFARTQAIFPNSKLATIDAGHLIQLEKPDELLSILIDFLNMKF